VSKRNHAIVAGALGAALYLSKAFGIFYFPLLAGFAYILIYRQQKNIFKHVAICFGVFFFLSGIWISLISLKYEKFTVNYAASYNSTPSMLPSVGYVRPHPIMSCGLINPKKNNSWFAWEEPFRNTSDEIRNSTATLEQKAEAVRANWLTFYYYQYKRQIGFLFLISLVAGIFLLRKKMLQRELLLLIITTIVFPLGYFPILIASRYIWIVTIVMALAIFFIATNHFESKKKMEGWILIVLCCVLLVKRPLKELLFAEDKDKSFSEILSGITHPAKTLSVTYNIDKDAFVLADSLSKNPALRGRVASFNNSFDAERESYPLTLIECLKQKNIYFGQLNDSIISREGLKPLSDEGVDFYYVWTHNSVNDSLVKELPLLFEDKKTGLRIYKVTS
jgi:hypothetical protein